MNYQHKYLKYKDKYSQLKKQLGGSSELEKLKQHLGFIYTQIKSQMQQLDFIYRVLNQLKKIYNDNSLYCEILNKIKNKDISITNTELNKCKNLVDFGIIFSQLITDNIITVENVDTYIGKGLKLLLQQSGYFYEDYLCKKCSIDELMSRRHNNCSNSKEVNGSCSWPSFRAAKSNDCIINQKLLNFFDLLMKKNTDNKELIIIVGSWKIDSTRTDSITVMITPITTFLYNLDDNIKFLTENSLQQIYKIRTEFPLTIEPIDKIVLDKIIEMTEKIQVTLINRICGTCFPSFYYLVKNTTKNFTYEVTPEQGMTAADTPNIKRCFKKL
jgi:hypothetical protein